MDLYKCGEDVMLVNREDNPLTFTHKFSDKGKRFTFSGSSIAEESVKIQLIIHDITVGEVIRILRDQDIYVDTSSPVNGVDTNSYPKLVLSSESRNATTMEVNIEESRKIRDELEGKHDRSERKTKPTEEPSSDDDASVYSGSREDSNETDPYEGHYDEDDGYANLDDEDYGTSSSRKRGNKQSNTSGSSRGTGMKVGNMPTIANSRIRNVNFKFRTLGGKEKRRIDEQIKKTYKVVGDNVFPKRNLKAVPRSRDIKFDQFMKGDRLIVHGKFNYIVHEDAHTTYVLVTKCDVFGNSTSDLTVYVIHILPIKDGLDGNVKKWDNNTRRGILLYDGGPEIVDIGAAEYYFEHPSAPKGLRNDDDNPKQNDLLFLRFPNGARDLGFSSGHDTETFVSTVRGDIVTVPVVKDDGDEIDIKLTRDSRDRWTYKNSAGRSVSVDVTVRGWE